MCAYVYPHMLNIGVLGIYKGWNRYRVEIQIWRPPHSQNDRRHEKTWRLSGNLWTPCIQKTPTVYSAYSLFFKERKLQKKNSRNLAKFQNLLERRRLVGHEKSVAITGSLFSKCSWFVFLVMWQEKNFPYPCVKHLAQPFPPAAQSHWWQNTSRRSALPVLVLTGFLLEQLQERRWQRRPWAHLPGEGSVSVNGSVLAGVCSYRVLSISTCNRNNDQGIEAFLS